MEWQKERSDAIKKYFRAQGIAQTDIAITLNVSKQYVNDVLNGRATIGKGLASRLSEAYGLSPAWLLTGEGEMLKGGKEVLKAPMNVAHIQQNNTNSPNATMYANTIPINNNARVGTHVESVRPVVPTDLYRKPNTDIYNEIVLNTHEGVENYPYIRKFSDYEMYLPILDDANAPRIERGDYLALAELGKEDYIVNGSVYAIDTYRMGMIVRILIDRGTAYDCQSLGDRQRYADFSVPKGDVIRIFRIMGMVRVSV
jgi:transcriptional regulator with XRE-family HTH domain